MKTATTIALIGVGLIFADYALRPEGPAGWVGFIGIVLALGAAIPIILGRRENV